MNGVRRRLEHDGIAGGQRLAELVDGDLEREVPRHDRPDHPTGSRQILRVVSWPVMLIVASPRSVSQGYSSISVAG